jgi:16S rRNA (cytidine1402-2'-O)-methyltransferase
LFVVATPLGNLEDLSPRAVRVLRDVALIACEDTRRTATLLRAHGITTPSTSYFEHNERQKADGLLARLRAGQDLALVSDAGTPGISDPGYRLVRAAREARLAVVPIPGPSALVTALSVSGLPTDRFLFVGFLPARSVPRQRALAELALLPFTLVFYESPLRLLGALAALQEAFGDRAAFLCREATKLHEEYVAGTLSELQALLAGRAMVKGECVLVVDGAGAPAAMEVDAEAMFAQLQAQGLTRREAVKQVAQATGRPTREVYQRLLVQANEQDEPDAS